MRWFVGRGPRPRFEHFTYWEKFDYWAVLWGTVLMGAAGLVLWFPVAASRVLPGWMFNVALFVHGAEATLAIGFIFVVHSSTATCGPASSRWTWSSSPAR